MVQRNEERHKGTISAHSFHSNNKSNKSVRRVKLIDTDDAS